MSPEHAHPWGEGVRIDTPNIDKLATQGALFSNYYVTSPTCTPARGAFFSGLYPSINGAYFNHVPFHDDVVTFGDILQNQGYKTGYLGKWHLSKSVFMYMNLLISSLLNNVSSMASSLHSCWNSLLFLTSYHRRRRKAWVQSCTYLWV